MATETFRVRARIIATDETKQGVASVDRSMSRLENRAQRTGMSISRFLGGAFALLGGGAALGVAARGVVGLQTEIQNAEGSLATLFTAFEGVTMAEGMSMAKDEVDKLSRAAASGVGGLQDYLDAFQLLFSPARAAGASFEEIEKFAADSLTAAAAMGKELAQAPLDIVQALQQGVNDKITPIAAQALKAAGITAEEFNKLDVRSKMTALSEGFGRFSEGAELMGQQWDAQVETLFDGIKRIARIITKPLFERWSQSLRDVNKWIERNEGSLSEMAETAGPKLLDFFDQAIVKARTLAAITAGLAIGEQVKGLKQGGGGGLGGVLSGVPSGLVKGTGGFRGAAGGFARSSGFDAAALIMGILQSLGRVAGPLALVALAFTAVEAASRDYPDLFGKIAAQAAFAVGSLGMLGDSFLSLGSSGSALATIGAALILPFNGLGTALGFVARGLALVIEGVNLFMLGIGDVVTFIMHRMQLLAATARGDVFGAAELIQKNLVNQATARESKEAGVGRINRLLGLIDEGAGKGDADADAALDAKLGKGAEGKGKGDTINIAKVEVHPKTELNLDPTRGAKMIGEVFEDLNRFRKQPSGVPGVSF